jgi:hypothetical protein
MIGATNIMRLAGAAERALQDSRPAEVVEGILKKLAAALTTLREEAKPLLEPKAGPEPARNACIDAARIDHAGVDELCALLEAQNLAAVEKFEGLSASLRGLLGAARYDGLSEAVENLDFQVGAELLRDLPRERRSSAA